MNPSFHPIAFNLIPQIDGFLANGYTREEMKMVNETRKILGIPDLPISCTCVRVPVFIGHSEACLVETQKDPSIDVIREKLNQFPGVTVLDDPSSYVYPTPLQCEDTDEVYVGRLRRDLSSNKGILYWVVADNLRRGAATNACNIVRALVRERDEGAWTWHTEAGESILIQKFGGTCLESRKSGS